MRTTKIQKFTSEIFGEIRTCQVNNQIMFVGKDVATALGYRNTRDALNKHVDAEDTLTATQVAKTFNMTVWDFNHVLDGLRYLNSKLGYPNF